MKHFLIQKYSSNAKTFAFKPHNITKDSHNTIHQQSICKEINNFYTGANNNNNIFAKIPLTGQIFPLYILAARLPLPSAHRRLLPPCGQEFHALRLSHSPPRFLTDLLQQLLFYKFKLHADRHFRDEAVASFLAHLFAVAQVDVTYAPAALEVGQRLVCDPVADCGEKDNKRCGTRGLIKPSGCSRTINPHYGEQRFQNTPRTGGAKKHFRFQQFPLRFNAFTFNGIPERRGRHVVLLSLSASLINGIKY